MRQIFIHGLGQDASSWAKTLSLLPRSREAVCPNLTVLAPEGAYTYAAIYKAFCGFCRKEEGPLHLCGLSLGAVLALHFALDYPEKVASLILIAPQYKMPKALLRLQNTLFYCMPNAAFQKMGLPKKALIALSTSMLSLDFTQRLGTISCPTLVLCGEKDRANRAACQTAAHLIPTANLRFMEHAGHEVNLDAPEDLAAAIRSFWG